MKKFDERQIRFLESMEECRIATSHDDVPHVKPVSYLLIGGDIVIATDYGTRTFENLKANKRIAVAVDAYEPGAHRAVLAQGEARIVDEGPRFRPIFERFFEKFAWVRRESWKEGEAPFVVLNPKAIASWGI